MAIRPADQIIHKAAWLYYAHGLRQDQVAQQLNISRASVAMYLRKAREMGIVTISTSSELFSDDVLARELEDATGLIAAWLVPEDRQAMDPAAEMPVVAASVFLELINKGDRIGVTGSIRLDTFTTRDGVEKSKITMRVGDVTLLGDKRDDAPKPKPRGEAPKPERDELDDELPF